MIHQSDKDSQYLSICYSERPAEADIRASTGTTREAYDNVWVELIIGFKIEVFSVETFVQWSMPR